jgi:single-strand DNA-binding protein
MNASILQGNLTHDPLLKYLEINGKKVAVCNFSIATHRHFRKANGEKHKETTFIDCEAWDSGAETIAKYVRKGDSLLVRGSFKNDSWERDGQKFSKLKLRVEEFDLPPRPRRPTGENGNHAPANNSDTNSNNDTGNTNNGNDIPF